MPPGQGGILVGNHYIRLKAGIVPWIADEGRLMRNSIPMTVINVAAITQYLQHRK